MIGLPRLVPVSVVWFAFSLPAYATGEAHDWLLRIHKAAQEMNYEGTFVYQHGGQLDTMRVYHRAEAGAVKERLISLTGPAREVIRTDDEVLCYLPDQKSVYVEHRRLDGKGFVTIIPERLADLEHNYIIELGKRARVAGRPTQQLSIRARDDYRYGYRLWADRETGLLLKADLINDRGKALEQFMFTQISIGGNIPVSALEAQTPVEGLTWYRDNQLTSRAPTKSWRATRLPKGFKLSSSVLRRLPKAERVVEQLVYSDSLAAVSVFVEKLDNTGTAEMLEGPMRMGGLYVLSKILEGHYVTVVGEVPPKTIVMIGSSLVAAPSE